MTVAICFTCGEFKVGALTPCPHFGDESVSLDEQAHSLAITDHYLTPEDLTQMQQRAVNGLPVDIAPEFYGQLLQTIREEQQRKPGWKFW